MTRPFPVESRADRDRFCALPGLSELTPDLIERHRPDESWAVADGGSVIARCSLWWTEAPPLAGQRVGAIGHYAASDPRVVNPPVFPTKLPYQRCPSDDTRPNSWSCNYVGSAGPGCVAAGPTCGYAPFLHFCYGDNPVPAGRATAFTDIEPVDRLQGIEALPVLFRHQEVQTFGPQSCRRVERNVPTTIKYRAEIE